MEEEARIQAQLDEAERTIKRERMEVDRRRAREEDGRSHSRDSPAEGRANTDQPCLSHSSPNAQRGNRDDDLDVVIGDDYITDADHGSVNPVRGKHESTNVEATGDNKERGHTDAAVQDGGDVVIEAGEDAVIY